MSGELPKKRLILNAFADCEAWGWLHYGMGCNILARSWATCYSAWKDQIQSLSKHSRGIMSILLSRLYSLESDRFFKTTPPLSTQLGVFKNGSKSMTMQLTISPGPLSLRT
ncbi:hypothetical protein AVEN_23025-1 [Araneus ventricosus]|uniref:Uncharacterized protein n=1 Tax=Araneus ventricosus TaxID=182803 RepID=A0A4Y2LNS7_ARAVE|nr:hypothetical protein AVEN_23025-1 [Araneus ventricosus]